MADHENVNVVAGPQATILHRQGSPMATLKNNSFLYNVYLSSDQSININSSSVTTLRPLGTVTLTGEVDTYGQTNPGQSAVVEISPSFQVTPAPSDIAAQIALQGINVTVTSNVDWINVTSLGADPTGVNPSGAIINSAIANNPNKDIYIPAGTYALEVGILAAPVLANNSQHIFGAGWDSILKPIAGANFDVISTPIPASAGAGTFEQFVRYYGQIFDLAIDGSNMAGTTAGQGNGIHLYGCRYWQLYRLYIHNIPNFAILGDGDNVAPGNNFGYDNQIYRNVFDLNNGNIRIFGSEAYDLNHNRFKWAGANLAAAQPAFAPQDTNALHLRCDGGYIDVSENVFGKGGSYTTEAIRLNNNGTCRILGNRFDGVRNQAIVLNAGGHIIEANQFSSPGSAATGVPAIQIGSNNNTIVANEWDIESLGGPNWTYDIAESGGPFSGNLIVGNLTLGGTLGVFNPNATSTYLASDNNNFSPLHHTFGAIGGGWGVTGHSTYALIGNGILLVSMSNLNIGTLTDGTTIYTSANGLPVGYRPASARRYVAVSETNAGTSFQINADGSIQIFGFTAAGRCDFEVVLALGF